MENRAREREHLRRLCSAATVAALTLAPAVALTPQAAAQNSPDLPHNAVITWDIHTQSAIEEAIQSPTAAARCFAVVHGAVYDAVNTIAGTPYEPYLAAPPSRQGDSTPAAVATAAYRVLLWMFPDQDDTLRAQYDRSLAAVPDGPSEDGGVAVGEATAAAMIDARQGDGAFDPEPWPVGTEPGEYRLTPPDFRPFGAWVATLESFVLPDPGVHQTPGPPALTSTTYAQDLNEVKRLGSENSRTRTLDQTGAAKWWDDARMVEWAILRQLATRHRLSILETARMFAMVDISVGDTMIACYKAKVDWSFWRPVTSIPLADIDGNPATRADANWLPLRETSPSAEYPSGHACFTSAVTTALRTFFGRDDLTFSAYSALSDSTRRFHSLSTAMAELKEARIWAGVHYRFAVDDGERLGADVTHDVLDEAFGPSGD